MSDDGGDVLDFSMLNDHDRNALLSRYVDLKQASFLRKHPGLTGSSNCALHQPFPPQLSIHQLFGNLQVTLFRDGAFLLSCRRRKLSLFVLPQNLMY
jgi:hypothetical protein